MTKSVIAVAVLSAMVSLQVQAETDRKSVV